MRFGWWRLGTAIPGLMALAFGLDVAGRVVPLQQFAFRAWEAALRVTPGGPGPFEPNRVFKVSHAYGDLAALGNVWDLRQYRDEEVVTDRWGYRNPHETPPSYEGIVTGDSFVVATRLSETETLPGRLEGVVGTHFYNAGGIDPLDANGSIGLARDLHIENGFLIFELLERRIRRGADKTIDAQAAPTFVQHAPSLRERLSPGVQSPLQIFSARAFKRAQDDVWLPNPYESLVFRRRLTNGQDMLFLPEDAAPQSDHAQLASAWADYFSKYAAVVRPRGLTLVVLLVPNKLTAFSPGLGSHEPGDGTDVLDTVEQDLARAGVPVLNLVELFRTRTENALSTRQYLYWIDDTHWNSAGTELAAAELAKTIYALRRASPSQRKSG